MAIKTRRIDDAAIVAIAMAHNADRVGRVASNFHADQSNVTTGPADAPVVATLASTLPTNAVDITTSIALCNAIRSVLSIHMGDFIDQYGAGAHKVSDATNSATLGLFVPTTGVLVTDTAAVVAAINLHQTSYNAHLTQSGVHYTNDATNTNATAAATNLATAETLLNSMKTSITAHMAGAIAGYGIRLGSA
jgi:hypothetical protein